MMKETAGSDGCLFVCLFLKDCGGRLCASSVGLMANRRRLLILQRTGRTAATNMW